MVQIGFIHRTWKGKKNYFEDKCSDAVVFTTAISLNFTLLE